ncbi:50S ribosomal protein L22 [Acidiplasma sp.]|uniref:50S ribosomal protein L22 n=1 Tax=Acidiplasma sp. TaxID=1872114 RepID=UPI0031661589
MRGYSIKNLPEKYALARLKEEDISLKDAVNIAHFLKGKKLESAKNILDGVIEKKIPVPYFRYLDSVSHRKGIGPGRYPVKAAKAFKRLLNDVSANAEFKGLSENLLIYSIAASKGRVIKKYTPKAYGRAGAFYKELINVDVVVTEEGQQ